MTCNRRLKNATLRALFAQIAPAAITSASANGGNFGRITKIFFLTPSQTKMQPATLFALPAGILGPLIFAVWLQSLRLGINQ